MLKIYQRLWGVTWAEQWQYRASQLMYLFYFLVSPVIYLSVWTSVANAQGTVKGLTANDFITYYLALLIVNQFTSDITIHILAYRIQDGTLSSELLKPVHPILTHTLTYNVAFKALTFTLLTPIWIVLCLLFKPDFSAVTLTNLLLAIPALILGFLLNFFFGAIITCLAFWTTRVYSVSEFFYAFVVLLAGQFVPLDLMPPIVQRIAQYLPFQLSLYFPIQLILGKVPPEIILRNFILDLIWLLVLFALFSLEWRNGVRRFSAVGG